MKIILAFLAVGLAGCLDTDNIGYRADMAMEPDLLVSEDLPTPPDIITEDDAFVPPPDLTTDGAMPPDLVVIDLTADDAIVQPDDLLGDLGDLLQPPPPDLVVDDQFADLKPPPPDMSKPDFVLPPDMIGDLNGADLLPPPPDMVPSCVDGVKNNGETDTDCGGAKCPKCVGGKACLADGDCTLGWCNASKKCGAFVGDYALGQSPAKEWSTWPPVYTCQEACKVVFGGNASDYACSTDTMTVDHLAWVDGCQDRSHCAGGGAPVAENYKKGEVPSGLYKCSSMSAAFSAFVVDGVVCRTSRNNCFK